MTDQRDALLLALDQVARGVNDALPGRVSTGVDPPPQPDLNWVAGAALQRIIEAGVAGEDVLALAQQVRVRAIADALALVDQARGWSVCAITPTGHQQLDGLDSEFWFLANQGIGNGA
jgi:hypothetical protein